MVLGSMIKEILILMNGIGKKFETEADKKTIEDRITIVERTKIVERIYPKK